MEKHWFISYGQSWSLIYSASPVSSDMNNISTKTRKIPKSENHLDEK
jgi:hypothetical protein